MKTETIEKILNFLDEKEDRKLPKKWFFFLEKVKLVEKLENHPEGKKFKYNGYLALNYTNITKLPDNLYVVDLGLFGCKQLIKLPDNLYVKNYLDLRETNIEDIPNNLYVGGDLWIGDTPLAKKYNEDEIFKLIQSRGGKIVGNLFRI